MFLINHTECICACLCVPIDGRDLLQAALPSGEAGESRPCSIGGRDPHQAGLHGEETRESRWCSVDGRGVPEVFPDSDPVKVETGELVEVEAGELVEVEAGEIVEV